MSASTRSAAILFLDIAGSTELRTRLGDAAAGQQIERLLAEMGRLVAAQQGGVVKSDGDDVLAVFEREPVPDAAIAAILCQRQAAGMGLKLYAGLHAGAVEFRESYGRPDVFGNVVNLASRLHKLVADAPGSIFLAGELLPQLPEEVQALAERYGERSIKGIGDVDVWTLHWQETDTCLPTRFVVGAGDDAAQEFVLHLQQADREHRYETAQSPVLLGRGRDCTLRFDDPEQRISSRHLRLESRGGRWFARDLSRNGTWFKAGEGREEQRLLNAEQLLPAEGALSLGRPFSEAQGEPGCLVHFRLSTGRGA